MAIGIASLLRVAGLAALTGQAQAAAQRAARRAALGAATALLGLLAFGVALAAFTVWLSGKVGTIEALAIVAAAFLVLAVIAQGVAAGMRGRRSPQRPAFTASVPPLGETFRADGAPPAGSELGSMAVIALVGYVLAQQLRRK